jgi:hypothetical protein
MYYLEGSRNDKLFRIACAMFGRGCSYKCVEQELEKENRWCKPPLPANEIRTIIRSASRYEPESVKAYHTGLCVRCRQNPHTENGEVCEKCLKNPDSLDQLYANWLQEDDPEEYAEQFRLKDRE